MRKKMITVEPYPGENTSFMGLYVPEPCTCCGSVDAQNMHVVHVGDQRMVLCSDCLEELRYQAGSALHKDIKVNETVWELVLCDDGKWHIFPMVVKSVRPYGAVRYTKKEKEPTVWNIYAEGDSTYMYKNFYELGKSWFYMEEEAKAALNGKLKAQSDNWEGNRPFDANAIKSGGE